MLNDRLQILLLMMSEADELTVGISAASHVESAQADPALGEESSEVHALIFIRRVCVTVYDNWVICGIDIVFLEYRALYFLVPIIRNSKRLKCVIALVEFLVLLFFFLIGGARGTNDTLG